MKTWREKYEEVFTPFYDIKIELEKISRPYKYTRVDLLAKKICEWMIERRENNQSLSVIGLCVHLGITRVTLDNMRGYSEDFKNLVDVTKNCIEDFWCDCLGTSETAAKFILSAMQGYTEVTKTIIESDNFVINVKRPDNK